MFRFLLRPLFLLTLLAALPIVVIRARPYDDSDLRALLTPPENCPAPCFMGIRPGVTAVEEAIAILEAHEWVAAIDPNYTRLMQLAAAYEPPALKTLLSWEWSANKPDWINGDRSSGLIVINRKIEGVMIQTDFPLGEILVTEGKPDAGDLLWSKNNLFRYSFAYLDRYPAYCMKIDVDRVGLPGHPDPQPARIQTERIDFLKAHAAISLNVNCES